MADDTKLCPGFPAGSCMTRIPRRMFLCSFCTKSMRLAA